MQNYVMFRPRKSSDLAIRRPMQNVETITSGANMKSAQVHIKVFFTSCRFGAGLVRTM